MSSVVIDCNVLIVANKMSDSAGEDCEEACITRLMQVKLQRECVLLDESDGIWKEYDRYIPYPYPPGMVSEFFYWMWQGNSRRVVITPRINTDRIEDYEEFPSDPALANFDKSDRKYVAVAIASKRTRPSSTLPTRIGRMTASRSKDTSALSLFVLESSSLP